MIIAGIEVSRIGVKLDPEQYIKSIVAELDEDALQIKTNFDLSTATWADRPVFDIKKTGEYERQISTYNENYARLNKGTRVRYVIMTPDFIAKSQANSLSAGSGRGGVLRHTNTPRPGIKARNFDKQVVKIWDSKFAFNMRVAIDNAGRK